MEKQVALGRHEVVVIAVSPDGARDRGLHSILHQDLHHA
jgi:hypothetical protein